MLAEYAGTKINLSVVNAAVKLTNLKTVPKEKMNTNVFTVEKMTTLQEAMIVKK